MGELKRAQEMRSDEFSRNELRESHVTIHELTSQIQELQERMNYMNDSREFEDAESICSGKLSHVPSQPAGVPSPRSMLSRDQSLRSDTWNLSGTQGNVFGNPRAVIDSSQTPHRGILHTLPDPGVLRWCRWPFVFYPNITESMSLQHVSFARIAW